MNVSYFTMRDSVASSYRPFDRIPNELIALILVWTSKGLKNDGRRFTFPVGIAQLISRRWKDITVATPALWTTLRVDSTHTQDGLQSYQEKSGRMPLSLNIFCLELLPVLVPHAKRWERVTIWMNNEADLDKFFNKISSIAISLRHFSSILPTDQHTHGRVPWTGTGLLSSDLESLHLTNVFLRWRPAPLSLRNLTELILRALGIPEEGLELEGFMDTLRGSPHLRRLQLFALVLPGDEVVSWLLKKDQDKIVDLHALEELVLAEFYVNEFLFLTSQVRCPNLRTLGIGLLHTDPHRLPPEVDWNTLSPSYPHLRQLDLWSQETLPEQLFLVTQNITPVSVLGIQGDGSRYQHEWRINDLNFVRCVKRISHLGKAVRTVKTRGVSMHALYILIRDCFPKTELVFKHWKDVDAVEGVVKFSNGLLKVFLWGERSEEIWDLEGMDGRMERIDFVLG